MAVEHYELSFHKRSNAFNPQAYGIFATNLKNANLLCVLLNKAKKDSSIAMLLKT